MHGVLLPIPLNVHSWVCADLRRPAQICYHLTSRHHIQGNARQRSSSVRHPTSENDCKFADVVPTPRLIPQSNRFRPCDRQQLQARCSILTLSLKSSLTIVSLSTATAAKTCTLWSQLHCPHHAPVITRLICCRVRTSGLTRTLSTTSRPWKAKVEP